MTGLCASVCSDSIRRFSRWWLCAGIIVSSVNTKPAVANPTAKDPTRALATHNTVSDAAKATELQAMMLQAEKFVQEAETALKNKGPAAMQPKLIGQWKAKTNQGFREAGRLQIMGEPLGSDLALRFNDLSSRINPLAHAYGISPPGQVLRPKVLAQLRKQEPARARDYERMLQLAAAKKFLEAENAIDKIAMQLDEVMLFITLEERQPFYTPYQQVRSQIEPGANQQRVLAAKQKFSEAMLANTPDVERLKSWGATVIQALQTSGKAPLDGKGESAGPDCLKALNETWLTGHTSLQRKQALTWANRWHAEGTGSGSGEGTATINEASVDAETKRWTEEVLNVAVGIIAADTASLQTSDVSTRYQQYLSVLADYSLMTAGSTVPAKLSEALVGLLAKNSVLETSVKNYVAATRDLITFQQRIDTVKLRALEQQFGPADAVVYKMTEYEGLNPGLHPANSPVHVPLTLSYPSSLTMAAIAPKLNGAKLTVENVHTLPIPAKTLAGEFRGRTYATLPALNLPASEIANVRGMLLLDDSHPPLTLPATIALKSVTDGHYAKVGGTVVGSQMEAMITRFATMSPIAATVIPRGAVPNSGTEYSMLNQMAIRVDVEPLWVQHPLGIYQVSAQ